MLKKIMKSKKALTEEFLEELFLAEIDEEKLSYLLSLEQFNINHQDEKGNTFLHKCVISNKLKSAQWLIEDNADIEIQNSNNITPLQILIENQTIPLLEFILNKKIIDLNKKDNFGRTLLQNAVVLGYLEVARLFINHGVDINSKDNNNRNVLFDALSFGNKPFIKYLLSFKELDINFVDINQDTILHHPQAKQEDDNAITLLEAGADATIKNKEGETFLCNTALRGIEAEKVIETALDTGNDINSRVKNNHSILMELVAASSKTTDTESERRDSLLKISKVLINKGIDVNAIDNNNETALFRAVRQEDKEQVGFLLSAGIDTNIVNNQYETPLSIAALKGVFALDIILLLLHNGADPSIKNEKKQSLFEVLNELVLHTHNKKTIADQSILNKINSSGQYLMVLKEILSHKKDALDFFDTKGNPLFFEPLLEDHYSMFKLYIQNGINIQKQNINGHNLFYEYVQKVFEEDNTDIDFQNNLSVLMSKKVNHNSQDHTGYTVLHQIMHTNCNEDLFDTLTEVVQFDYKLADNLGRSVIHAGVWNDKKIVMKKIHTIDSKTVNIPDIYGILPITYAALLGNQELVLLLLELQSNIKSNVKIAPQAVEKFKPMLKNLKKLEFGLDETQLSHVHMLVEQILLDFNVDKDQRMYSLK